MEVIDNPNKNSNGGHYIKSAYRHKGLKYYIKRDPITHNYYCSKLYKDGTGYVVQREDFSKELPREINNEIMKDIL